MSHALRLILFVSAIAVPLTGCGNKGPLVLPDKAPEQQQDKDKKKDQPATPQPAAKAADAAIQH